MVTKRQNRKDHSVSAIFLIFSIFSNRKDSSDFYNNNNNFICCCCCCCCCRNQMSLFSRKAYDKLIVEQFQWNYLKWVFVCCFFKFYILLLRISSKTVENNSIRLLKWRAGVKFSGKQQRQ